MRTAALIGLLPLAPGAPALAQTMAPSMMPGMQAPAPTAKPSTVDGAAADPHAGHDMGATPADPHAGHDMGSMADKGDIPDTPAPPAPTDHATDKVFDPAAMARARAQLRKEHGGGVTSMVAVNIAEWAPRSGKDSYRWEGEAWFGGDIDRLTLKSEGGGVGGDGLDHAELQALYSRSVGPYFNLQAGVRQDFEPKPSRTYATIGFEGLAPYWFEVGGAAFVSDKGDLSARFEGSYDQRLTQRLILQPRAELNLAASNDRATGVGSGLSEVELGLRLRYEVRREFAPYVGVTYDRKFGKTADHARAGGEDVEDARVVLGLRAWF